MQATTVVAAQEPEAEGEARQGNGFQLTVKVKGQSNYAGKGWVNPSKFGGKYVSVFLSQDVKAGSTLYLTPKKDCASVLG